MLPDIWVILSPSNLAVDNHIRINDDPVILKPDSTHDSLALLAQGDFLLMMSISFMLIYVC